MGQDPRHFSIMSKKFLDDGEGNVCGVETIKVEWKKDNCGRYNMSTVPGMKYHVIQHVIALTGIYCMKEFTVVGIYC